MEKESLKGKFIGVKENVNVFMLSKIFTCENIGAATLKITALGLYKAEINGVRVGDAYLTPGWTSYKKMLQVQTYDVTELLRCGENEIVLTVAEGWYCGRLVWKDSYRHYGDRPAVCADLRIDGTIVSTDGSWTARESFIRFSSLYDGETQDFCADRKRLTPIEIEFDKTVLVKQLCEPVRDVERIAVQEVLRTPSGETVYDFGQNIAGAVVLRLPTNCNGKVTCEFAEILVRGEFYKDNYRTAKSEAIFIGAGGKTVCPEFAFFGFRYMKLTGIELAAENVTAIVRHSDLRRTGEVITSDARFDRLMQNIVWGQRDNFVDIPSDCPQRDERLGWTGDINAFCRTAAYNYDIRNFMKKWLADLRNDQRDNGEVPHIVPDVLKNAGTCAMWCDAAVMIPWTLYEMYGDGSFLTDNYEAMKKYLAARENNTENGLMAKGYEYGDWLALDREQLLTNSAYGRTDEYYISNVFYAHTLDLTARTAHVLGDAEEERRLTKRRKKLLRDMRREYFTPSGRLAFDTVTAQVLALHFGIAEEKHRARLARALNDNVIKHDYKVCTGFIGTPFLLFALCDNGYTETTHKVLLNDKYPSWLYQVDMGATTVWERWNSLLPDGTPNPDGMNSYNHYAYGSVMEFVYRRIAGIEPLAAGFSKVRIAPMPIEGIDEVRAAFDSVHGKITAGYTRRNGKITYFATVPPAVQAEFVIAGEGVVATGNGKFSFER